MAAQRGDLDLADVDAVNQDLAPLELIVAADQRQNRAFAGAGGPHKRHRLTRVHMEGDALQHPLAGYVAEPDIPKFDFAPHLVQLDGIGGVHHLRLDVHEREHLFRGGQRRLQPVELLGQVLDGGEELGDVHVKGHDGAAGDGLAQKRQIVKMAHAAQIEQAQNGTDVQHIDQRAEYAEHKDLLLRDLGERLAFLAELRHLLVLAAKDLRDLDAGQVLRQVGVDVGGGVLHLAVGAA